MKAGSSSAWTIALAIVLTPAAPRQALGKQPQSPIAQVARSAALSWGPSELPGIELAAVSGDASKAGELFVLRARMQNGAKFPVHTHPGAENVTVLKGTLLVGVGDTFDAGKAEALGPADFVRIPAGLRHFAQAQGEVVIEVSGLGPFAIDYANPADVPTKVPPRKS
jgi:quercetin dioxygenase-like cupin family protein